MVKDFLNEILDSLEKIRYAYQKSNDEKSYLASIKSTIRNIISDKELKTLLEWEVS